MMLDILFLGRLFPKGHEVEIKCKMKTGMQDAANALQWNIIDGMDGNNCGKIKILNYLPVDSYPNGYTDKHIEGFTFQHTNKYNANDLNVACSNLTIVKQIVNYFPFKKEVKNWASQNDGRRKFLISYTANPMFLNLARFAKTFNNTITTCCIIADLPAFATARELHGIKKLYNIFQVWQSNALYQYIDKFVLLTEQMAEKLRLKSPHLVMEGIAPDPSTPCDDSISNTYKGKKYILYSGTLNYEFGIRVLLDAFSLIQDQSISLVICGFGEAEQLIAERKNNDKRIIFLGRLERSAVLSLQRYATVLVNPRQNTEEFTKYSFPSKTLEYLASGVPVIAYKLDGIPDEYDSYISYVPDNTPQALASVITRICSQSDQDRSAMGIRARTFILSQKNKEVQTGRILDFIRTV